MTKKSDPSNEQTVHQAHDKFFRTAMQDKRVARAFLEAHLPADILQVIDLNHLELQPRSYINDVRKESVVDVLFKTTISGREALLYLLVEHQSKPDKLMPFRVLKYTVNAMADYVDKTKKDTLPLIYPIVVYHGDKPWPYSMDIKDIVDAPKELVDRYFLQPFHMIDLSKIADEEIKSHAWAGIMEFALKYVFVRDILSFIKGDMTITMRRIVEEGGEKYVEIVLEYLMERGKLSSEDEFIDLINKEISRDIGGKFMNFVERIKTESEQKGMQQGMQQGVQQGVQQGIHEGVKKTMQALRMLANGDNVQSIVNVTGLTIEEVESLKQTMNH